MADLSGFDATKVDPNVGFDPVPAGDYTVIAADSEMKTTKDKKGSYLQFSLEIIDGEFKGRILFDRLNLDNANETAVKIAQGTLSSICHAVGVMKPKDSSELHGKPMVVKVAVKERNDQKGVFSNEVKGYKEVGAKSAAPAASGDESTPPWKR